MEKQTIKRYRQAFSQQVVRECEGGASIFYLMQKYGIGAHETVKRWVEHYSRAAVAAAVSVLVGVLRAQDRVSPGR